MAIVVEQDKQKSNTPALLGGVVIVAVIIASVYYLFFAAPPSVIVTPPPNFQAIQPIAGLNFNPTTITNSAAFQALKATIPEPTSTGPVSVGRSNPFAAL